MNSVNRFSLAVATTLLFSSCIEIPDPIAVDAFGGVEVLLYLDRNGDGQLNEGFDPVAGPFPLALQNGSGAAVASGTTNAGGLWRSSAIPVGRYRAQLPASALGDTLVLAVNPWVTAPANDTITAFVGLGYPVVTASQLDSIPLGRMVTVHGLSLQASPLFSDGLFHLRSGVAPVRAVPMQDGGAVPAGDSVVVVGRVGELLGRRAIVDATVTSLLALQPAQAATVTAAVAASANNGSADGALVRVAGVRVDSVDPIGEGGRRVLVSDASGSLNIVIDPLVAISAEITPGGHLNVTGILVPGDGDASFWTLRPRGNQDVAVATAPA
jgi:hypothetical protein